MPQVPSANGGNSNLSGPSGSRLRAPRTALLPSTNGVRAEKLLGGRIDARPFQAGQVDPVRGEAVDGGAQIAGRQMEQFGQALSQAGSATLQILTDVQNQANEIAVTEAVNRAKELQIRLAYDKEAGFTTQLGGAAMVRESGKPLSAEYLTKFDEAISPLGEGLKNDAQKRMFGEKISGMRSGFQAALVQHEAKQYKQWSMSTAKGQVETAMSELATGYNVPWVTDETNANSPFRDLEQGVTKLGLAQGKSATEIEADVAAAKSRAHTTVVQMAVNQGNVTFAAAYLTQNSDKITSPDDLLRVRGVIGDAIDTGIGQQLGTQYAQKIGQGAAVVGQTDFNRMVNITMNVGEGTGGKDYDTNGSLIVSPKGAAGRMQVMPDTGPNPGFGVRPSNGSVEDNARVGRDYLAAMLKRYGGDPAKAWAAYNWGPGNLDKALKTHGANWLAAAPQETRKYVARTVKALGQGEGASGGLSYEDAVQQVLADPALAGNPKRQRAALETMKYLHSASEAAKKEREDAAVNAAIGWAAENGGRFDAAPQAIRSAVPADKLPTVYAAARAIAEGSPSNPLTVSRLSDPRVLAAVTQRELDGLLGTELSKSDYEKFSAKKAELVKPAAAGTAATVHDAVNLNLRSMGLPPSPKSGQVTEAQRVNAIRRDMQAAVDAENEKVRATTGRDMSAAELNKFVANRFHQSIELRMTAGLFKAPYDYKQNMYSMTVADIPQETVTELRKDFTGQGFNGRQITDSMILAAYWAGKTYAKKK